MTKLRNAALAAIAILPLLAGAASAHGGWRGDDRGYGHGYARPHPGPAAHWRGRETRRDWAEAARAREWAWRRQAWEQRRFEPPRGGYGRDGWGPRW